MKKFRVLVIGIGILTGIIAGSFYLEHNKKVATIIAQRPIISSIPTISASLSTSPTPSPTPSNTCNAPLVLVDKIHALPPTYVPPDLVYISQYNIPVANTSYQIRKIVVPDLVGMIKDANAQGINLIVISPYRSYNTQAEVYDYYTRTDGVTAANQYSAIPGHSQHQLGTAIDFSTNEISNGLDQSFADTNAGKWMAENAYKYGFVLAYPIGDESITGYEYEPWHWRYMGVDNALKIKNSGLIMQQYLEKYGYLPNC